MNNKEAIMTEQLENKTLLTRQELGEGISMLYLGTVVELIQSGVTMDQITSAHRTFLRRLQTIELLIAANEWAYGEYTSILNTPERRRIRMALIDEGEKIISIITKFGDKNG